MGFFLIEYTNVYFLISVRVSCRYNSTDIFLHTSKTDGKSRVIISQRKSKNRNSETHRAEKKIVLLIFLGTVLTKGHLRRQL